MASPAYGRLQDPLPPNVPLTTGPTGGTGNTGVNWLDVMMAFGPPIISSLLGGGGSNDAETSGVMFDPTNPRLLDLGNRQINWLQNLYQGNDPFAGYQSPLAGLASGQMQGQITRDGAGGSPEAIAYADSQGLWNQLIGGGPMDMSHIGNPILQAIAQQQAGGNRIAAGFAGATQARLGDVEAQLFALANRPELVNPYADLGAFNQGQLVNEAAQPIFDRNLQQANAQLSNMAPNRFGSAFVQQGQDLATKALQDFNLFQQQNLMQGLALQAQDRQQALNFMLGARGLSQDAVLGSMGQVGANRLANAQMANQVAIANANNATQAAIASGQLGAQSQGQLLNALLGYGNLQLGAQELFGNQALNATNQMNTFAGQMGTNLFNRAQGAHSSALQQFQTYVDPVSRLLLGGLEYGMPSDLNVVGGVDRIYGADGQIVAGNREKKKKGILGFIGDGEGWF